MSIDLVQEISNQQRGMTFSEVYTRTYERVFQVVTSGVGLEGPKAVLLAVDPNTGVTIPELWSEYQYPYTSPTERFICGEPAWPAVRRTSSR